MEQVIKSADWPQFCKEFTVRNRTRLSVVQIVKDFGARTEERGLPFIGLDVEHRAGSLPDVIILLGEESAPSDDDRHLTHSVRGVLRITLKSSQDGHDQLLEIEDATGEHTLLHLLPN
jgi:Family of unknown function (DUF5335)